MGEMEVSLPPQPPPDAPAPPPGPEAIRSRRILRRIFKVGFGSILLLMVIAGLSNPRILLSRRPADRTEAIHNAKQVGLALLEFDATYGQFPDTTTIPKVKAETSTTLALGNSSSNALFRQLLANGIKSEKPFWAKTEISPRKGNDTLGPDALAKGECGFAYISGLSSAGDPSAPLIMTPMIPGTWKFDPKPFEKKAVVLSLDGSAKALPIDKNGDVILNGMNLFDPRQPYWHGKPPDIKWPE